MFGTFSGFALQCVTHPFHALKPSLWKIKFAHSTAFRMLSVTRSVNMTNLIKLLNALVCRITFAHHFAVSTNKCLPAPLFTIDLLNKRKLKHSLCIQFIL